MNVQRAELKRSNMKRGFSPNLAMAADFDNRPTAKKGTSSNSWRLLGVFGEDSD